MLIKDQLQSNVKYDPNLQQQVPKEELEKIQMENALLEQQVRENFTQFLALLKSEKGNALMDKIVKDHLMMLQTRMMLQVKGYISNSEPWRNLDG